jgi:hypothetical protein
MARFTTADDRVYVTVDSVSETKPADGAEWIAIKTRLSVGDKTKLEAASVGLSADGKTAQLNVEAALRAIYEVFLLDWRVLDGEREVPLSIEAFCRLADDEPLAVAAIEEITRRNPFPERASKPTPSGNET